MSEKTFIKISDLKTGPYLGCLAFFLVGLFISVFIPFSGLSPSGHIVFGSLVGALGLWIFKPGNIPYFAGAIVIIFGCVVAEVSIKTVTSGFSSASMWLLFFLLFFMSFK